MPSSSVPPGQDPDDRPRLAELLAALSLVTDLTRGHPSEEAIRACLVATELGRRTGLSDADLCDVYYATLLRFVGCTATSHEMALYFGGDDVKARARADVIDTTAPKELLPYLFGLSEGRPPVRRLQAFGAVLRDGRRVSRENARADCEVGARMAKRFDLNESVESSLYALFERWDGRGAPQGLKGEAIPLPARYAGVAFAAVMFLDLGGPQGAEEALRRWCGRALDPAIVRAFLTDAGDLHDAAATDDAWTAVLAAEPAPHRTVSERRIDEVARGFADVVDLKSPYFHGHSNGVADLAERAALQAGHAKEDAIMLRRAGWLHDLGRTAVATGIWEKPGPLSVAEWEHVRLHAYHTERILSRSTALQPMAALAGFHHERLDGSGYHRAAHARAIDERQRILAAADVYQALTEARPHRPPFEPPAAARELERTGGLDAEAVHAVLAAAGQQATRRRGSQTLPAGLTEREVEVLRLLVTGRSEKQIANELFVSPATVHTHVVHIYGKAGVSTRAGAAMFAMENDLIRAGPRS